jgi:hypothetical protein
MTKTSKKWRNKRINKNKRVIKIHNSILRGITGMMAVFFLLAILSFDNINKNIVLMFGISTIWLVLFGYANNLEHIEESE